MHVSTKRNANASLYDLAALTQSSHILIADFEKSAAKQFRFERAVDAAAISMEFLFVLSVEHTSAATRRS